MILLKSNLMFLDPPNPKLGKELLCNIYIVLNKRGGTLIYFEEKKIPPTIIFHPMNFEKKINNMYFSPMKMSNTSHQHAYANQVWFE